MLQLHNMLWRADNETVACKWVLSSVHGFLYLLHKTFSEWIISWPIRDSVGMHSAWLGLIWTMFCFNALQTNAFCKPFAPTWLPLLKPLSISTRRSFIRQWEVILMMHASQSSRHTELSQGQTVPRSELHHVTPQEQHLRLCRPELAC